MDLFFSQLAGAIASQQVLFSKKCPSEKAPSMVWLGCSLPLLKLEINQYKKFGRYQMNKRSLRQLIECLIFNKIRKITDMMRVPGM